VDNNPSSSPTIQNSTLKASGINNYSIYNLSGSTTRVGASKLEGAVFNSGTGSTLKCVASYNTDYNPLNSTCGYP
jgi:hypothetical protein